MLKLRLLIVSLLMLTFAVACTSQSTAVTPTKVAQPTTTPMPTPTATLAPYQVATGCGATFSSESAFFRGKTNMAPQFGQIGDLIFTQPALGFLSYPGVALPDNILPGKPFQVDTLAGPQIAANPYLGGGGGSFVFYICNSATTTSHTLQSLGINITSFTPDTSTKTNVEVGCDSPFNSQVRQVGTGCGGSLGPCNNCYFFHAKWPLSIATNTQGSLQHTGGNDAPAGSTTASNGNLPITLKAGASIIVWVGMDYPANPGTFTFTFGAKVDTADLGFVGIASDPVFLVKNAHKWAGLACQLTAAMNAQIPATGIDHNYVCPQTP